MLAVLVDVLFVATGLGVAASLARSGRDLASIHQRLTDEITAGAPLRQITYRLQSTSIAPIGDPGMGATIHRLPTPKIKVTTLPVLAGEVPAAA